MATEHSTPQNLHLPTEKRISWKCLWKSNLRRRMFHSDQFLELKSQVRSAFCCFLRRCNTEGFTALFPRGKKCWEERREQTEMIFYLSSLQQTGSISSQWRLPLTSPFCDPWCIQDSFLSITLDFRASKMKCRDISLTCYSKCNH